MRKMRENQVEVIMRKYRARKEIYSLVDFVIRHIKLYGFSNAKI